MKPKSTCFLMTIRRTPKLAALAGVVTILVVAVAALAGLAGRSARAFGTCGTCNRTFFGMVGIAPGQTARLNVFMPIGPPQVVVTLSFTDSNGSQLTDPQSGLPTQTSLMLATGQAASLDLAYPASANIPSGQFASGGRVELRALVEVSSLDGSSKDIVATLELFDIATGRTSVVLVPGNPG